MRSGEFPTDFTTPTKPGSNVSPIMEHICPELTDAVDLVESEVPFQYSVETTAFAAVFVDDFEELLLQRVADIVLTCAARATQRERSLEDEVRILKLAYPTDRSASSISKFDNIENSSCSVCYLLTVVFLCCIRILHSF